MAFGFRNEPRLEEPYHQSAFVYVPAGTYVLELTPDEARLYALKLIKAADKAEED